MNLFELAAKLTMDKSEFDSGVRGAASQGESLAQSLQNSFNKIGKAVIAGFAVKEVVDFGKQINHLAADAQTSAAKVNTLLSKDMNTSKYFNDMIAMSSKSGVAFNEFSESVYQALSAGVDAEKAVGFVANNAVKLAKGGFTDTATAIDILTTSMNAYKLGANDAEHITDVLIQTQNLGKTSVGELASYMGQIIPVAKAGNVSLEQLGASYSILTAGGMQTAIATTNLKSMIDELGKSSSEASKTLKSKTGKSFTELMNSGESLGNVLEKLYNAVGKNNTKFKELFGSTTAQAAALALLDAGSAKYNETLEKMKNASGVTEEAYKTMADTFNEKVNRMQVVASNFGVIMGQKLLPFTTAAVEGITNLMEKFGPKVANFVGDAITAGGNLINNIGKRFEPVTKAFTKATTRMTSSLNAAKVLFKNDGEKAIPTIIKNMAKSIGKSALEIGDSIGEAIIPNWQGVKTAFAQGYEQIKQPMMDTVAKVWAVFAGHGGEEGYDYQKGFAEAWDNVTKSIDGAFKTAVEAGTTIWKALNGDSEAQQTIKTALSDAWNNVKTAATDAWNGVKGTAELIWKSLNGDEDAQGTLKTQLEQAWENVKTTVSEAAGNALDTASQLWNALTGDNIDLRGGLAEAWGNLRDNIIAAGESGEGIIGKLSQAYTSVVTWWTGVQPALANLLKVSIKVDTDGDGKVSAQEWASWGERVAQSAGNVIKVAVGADTDGDGNVSPDEWTAWGQRVAETAKGVIKVAADVVPAAIDFAVGEWNARKGEIAAFFSDIAVSVGLDKTGDGKVDKNDAWHIGGSMMVNSTLGIVDAVNNALSSGVAIGKDIASGIGELLTGKYKSYSKDERTDQFEKDHPFWSGAVSAYRDWESKKASSGEKNFMQNLWSDFVDGFQTGLSVWGIGPKAQERNNNNDAQTVAEVLKQLGVNQSNQSLNDTIYYGQTGYHTPDYVDPSATAAFQAQHHGAVTDASYSKVLESPVGVEAEFAEGTEEKLAAAAENFDITTEVNAELSPDGAANIENAINEVEGTAKADAKVKEGALSVIKSLIDGIKGTPIASPMLDSSAKDRLQSSLSALHLTVGVQASITSGIQGVMSAIGSQVTAGHASGENRVPYDDYIAKLHKDEAVLRPAEADEWRDYKSRILLGDDGQYYYTGSQSSKFIERILQKLNNVADATARYAASIAEKTSTFMGGVTDAVEKVAETVAAEETAADDYESKKAEKLAMLNDKMEKLRYLGSSFFQKVEASADESAAQVESVMQTIDSSAAAVETQLDSVAKEMETQTSTITGSGTNDVRVINVNELASAIVNALKGVGINLDGERVGEVVADTVDRKIAQKANALRYITV